MYEKQGLLLNLKDRAQDTRASTVLIPILVPKVLGSVLWYGLLLARSQQWASSTCVCCAPNHRSYCKPWGIFCNVLPQVSYSSISHFLQAFFSYFSFSRRPSMAVLSILSPPHFTPPFPTLSFITIWHSLSICLLSVSLSRMQDP